MLLFGSRTNVVFRDAWSRCPLYLAVPMLLDYEDAASIGAIDGVSFS
ncbi:MAG TPA: hypothetical protein VIH09_05300 [Flavobacterium sp.]